MAKKAETQLYQNGCKVTIEGMGMGILFNNPASMKDDEPMPKRGKKNETLLQPEILSPTEKAEQAAYWLPDHSSIAFPAWNFYRAMIGGASALGKWPLNVGGKTTKTYLAPVIAGDVYVQPDLLSFGTSQYEVFTCRAVIPATRGGILRSKASSEDVETGAPCLLGGVYSRKELRRRRWTLVEYLDDDRTASWGW